MSTNGDIDSGVLLPELDLVLAELDDVEYNIPKVDKPPTLEDILNEDETSHISEEELSNYLPKELLPSNIDENYETGSITSIGSRGGHSPAYKKASPPENILQHVILRAVSAKIQEAAERTDGGWPTVVAVGGVIGVGTRHGLVMCFDVSQRLRWNHDTPFVREQGSVTCLALNSDSTRLLAGYARGLVLMFDSQDGRLLRTISPEAHTPFTAVVHLKFTDSPAIALLSDSGGSVFELGLKKVLGVRSYESRCVFSGSRGEVVAIEPLLLYNLPNHPLYGCIIVAMAALSKLMVVVVRPKVKVVFSQPSNSLATCLPLLSWQCVVIKATDSSRVMDPVLAFSRHDTISFYQVSMVVGDRIVCQPLQVVVVAFSLVACHWLTPRTLALVDSSENLHLLDVRSNQNLESIDLSSVALVYNSSAFKAIATGGNVSKAMALAGQRACYNSIQSSGSQLLILGKKSVHVISIRFWADRINNLVNQNRHCDALRLAMDFYEERGKAVLGLKGPRDYRQKLVRDKVLETLVKFIEYVLESPEVIHYPEAISTIVEHCLELDQLELLFERLWNGLVQNDEGRSAFLEATESAIMDGKISEVPPEVMQQLVTHLISTRRTKIIEECIQRVSVMCLDLEQVIMVCQQHALYSGLVTIWNKALGDYLSPIHELVPILANMINEDSSSQECRKLGNLLLVYVSTCLSGRSFSGEVTEQARQQVCKALCSQHSHRAADSETPFPYIRTLLEFDTREFLNALVIAFSDPALTLHMRQRIVDILIQVMTDSTSFKCTEVAMLLEVLSGSAGQGIRIDKDLYTETLDRLAHDTSAPHSAKESALLALVRADSGTNSFNRDHLLVMASQANFHQVCALLYEEMGDHGNVMKCHLLDPHWKLNIFSFIEHSPYKPLLSSAILDNIQALVDLSAERTGQIVGLHYLELLNDIVDVLSGQNLYYFIKGMREIRELNHDLMTKYVCLMCKEEPLLVKDVIRNNEHIEIDTALKACREFDLEEAAAVLLERSGDLQGAFDVLLKRFQRHIEEGLTVEGQTEELVRLAQRGNAVLDSKKSWLPLLMCLLKLNSHDVLQSLLSNPVLNLASELHLLMQHTQGTLGDLRNLIMGLFIKCKQERQMQDVLMRLHFADLHCELSAAMNTAKRGVASPFVCHACNNPFESRLCLFRCGHGYHEECILPRSRCLECFKSEDS